jgi:acyl-CoA synthetase (AMP-forming)/AMP-acid ligase II
MWTPVVKFSIPSVLRERASLQPNDTAFTYIDYEHDWEGVPVSLTWSQVYRRALNLAQQLRLCASTGDRAVLLAPQGLDYIISFLGASQAGLIPVPLSVPLGGATDERVSSVMRDAAPAVIVTTSSVVDNVAEYAAPRTGESAPSIVEVDLLDLDSRSGGATRRDSFSDIAYLQYTSGSTREPAGVMISHQNLLANFEQLVSDYFVQYGRVVHPEVTIVSWLPFYHDMGLIVGIGFPVLSGLRAVVTSPVSFLQRPARWMQLMASHSHALSGGPNFAFDLTARKTSDDDMAGLDLGDVHSILSGSERVQPATLQRFADRFARFNLHSRVLRPSYGMAEATVYIATREWGQPPEIVHFESEKMTAGHAKRCTSESGTPLVSYGAPESPMVRIVDPETDTECPAETVGEIWVHGDNVANGYWGKPEGSEHTFGATLVGASAGTPEKPWLRTGDSGFFSDGELFIVGRIKDLLIVYGRNHSPDDIEATVQEITKGRCVAIAVPDEGVEKLVTIIELKKRGDSEEDACERLSVVKREVTSAISNSHGLSVSDVVLVLPGSIPITTSGKVRRAECVQLYRRDEFTRLDA